MAANQLKFVDEDPDLAPQINNKFLDYDPDDLNKLDISTKFSDYDPDELPKMSAALSDFDKRIHKNFYAENKTPEEIKNMDMWQRLEYAKSLEKEFEYRKAKGFAKGAASGATFGFSEKIPGLSQAEDDMLFGLGEITGAAIPIEGLYSVLGKPLVALASQAPKAKAGLEALARMTGLGLAGGAYESTKDYAKTGEIPTAADVATHAGQWALLDGALQVTGKAASFAQRLGSEFRNASKVSKQQRVNDVISQLAKEGINPEVEPVRYATRAEELVMPKQEVKLAGGVSDLVQKTMNPESAPVLEPEAVLKPNVSPTQREINPESLAPDLGEVYHGTKEKFENFDFDRSGGMAFFTPKKHAAAGYATGGGGGRTRTSTDNSYFVDGQNYVYEYNNSKEMWEPLYRNGGEDLLIEKKDLIPLTSEERAELPDITTSEANYRYEIGDGSDFQNKNANIRSENVSGRKILDLHTKEGQEILSSLPQKGHLSTAIIRAAKKGELKHAFWGFTKASFEGKNSQEIKEYIVTPLQEMGYEGVYFTDDSHKSVGLFENFFKKHETKPPSSNINLKDRVKKNQPEIQDQLGKTQPEIKEQSINNAPDFDLNIQEKPAEFNVKPEPEFEIPEPVIETTGKGAKEQISYAKTSVDKTLDAMKSAIESAKTPGQTMRRMYEASNKAAFNFLAPLEDMEANIPVHERVSSKIKFAQSATSEINSVLENGIFNNVTGNFEHGGLKQAYGDLTWNKLTKNLPESEYNLQELDIYRDSKQVLKRQATGKKTGVDTAMAVRDVERLAPKYEAPAKNIRQYNRAVLETYGKDLLGESKINNWDKDFETSLYRVMDNGEGSILRQGSLKPKQPFHRFKGSARQHVPPSEADIYNTSMLITSAKKNEAVLQYAKLVSEGKLPGTIKKGKNLMIPESVLEDLDIPMDQLDIAENLYNQTRKNSFTPEKNILKGWKNGQPIEIHVPDNIYEVFSTFTPQDSGIMAKLFSTTNRIFSRGISLAPRKALSIVSRDALSSLIYSRTGENPLSVVEALGDTFGNSETYKQFLAMGGDVYAAKLGERIDRANKITDLITPGHEGKVVPFNQIGKFFRGYSEKMGNINMAVPMAEYNRALAKYGNTEQGRIMAALEARRVTYDPYRKGSSKIVRELGNYIPFWNVSLQDVSMLGNNLKKPSTWVKGISALTLPTLALKYINEGNPDYEALTPEDKAAFWHLYFGKEHVRIAIPWLLGTTFKVGAETLYDQISASAHGDDQKAKEAWQGLTANLTEQISGSVPPILQAYVEYNTGKSIPSPLGKLLGTESRAPDVVPRRLQDLPPELQYTSKTSFVARKFAQMWGLSPVKVERLLSTMGGLVAKDALALVDEMAYFSGLAEDKRPEQREKNYLLLGNFVSDSTSSRTKYQQQFYEYLNEATQSKNAATYIRKNGLKDANLEPITHKGVNLFAYNKQISAKLKLLRQIEDSNRSPADKKAEMIRIQKQINDSYKQAVDAVHQYESKQK